VGDDSVKKCLAVTLSTLILINLCACSVNTNSFDDDKLKYYAYYEDTICDIINKYNNYCAKHYDESYQIEIIEFDSQEEMNLKMSTEIMAGGGPDVFSLSQNLPFEKLSNNKTIADINELTNSYEYDIGLNNCNSAIMDVGVIGGKRYFIPLTYSPDVFITTEETLNKYDLSSSDFSYKALSDKLLDIKDTYSFLGGTDYNINFFYSFLNQYIDYNNGNTGFNTKEFSENLDYIYNLINNDSTNDNTYYFLYENINNGASILYKQFSSFDFMVRTYGFLYYLGGTPAIVNNYNKNENTISASVDFGIAINNNCKSKEKILPFLKYCLSDKVQKYLAEYCSLPVNNNTLKYLIDATDEPIDFGDDGFIDDDEKAIFKKARDTALNDYNYIIDNINECNLYSFYYLSETYFNSSVIGDIVDKYLSGDISKDKFIRQLTAATEIYLTE
jgi:ABC-type glycerol-3-phosphate transport system substrate-binding protein